MILVTGATGLLGSEILKQFAQKNIPLKALYRSEERRSQVGSIQGVEWIAGDILNNLQLQDAMKGVSCVIHVAALVTFDNKSLDKLNEINVNGTANVVNACLSEGVEKLIHISSVAAIGSERHDEGISTELSKWDNGSPHTAYAQSKYLAELEVWRGYEEGLRGFIINPSMILGQGDWSRSSGEIFKTIHKNSKYYTDGFLNFVDVRDVSEVLVKLWEKDPNHENYIINAGKITVHDFYSLVAKNLNITPPQKKISFPLLASIARVSAVFSFFTGTSPKLSLDTVRMLKRNRYYSANKLKSAVDHTYRPIEETISWCSDFLKKQYSIKLRSK